jgi:hypothetical protein
VAGAELPHRGEALACRCRRHDPQRHHGLVHGAPLSPQRAAVRAGRQEAADGEAVPVRRVRQREPRRGGGTDEVPEDHAALHRDEPLPGVDPHGPVEPPRADDGAGAAAGADQLGEAVGVPRGDPHLTLGRHRGRHGRDELLLAAWVGGSGRVAGSAVREGGICVGDGAVGGAVGAGYGIRRRARAGEAHVGKDEEQQEQHCPLSFHCSHDPAREGRGHVDEVIFLVLYILLSIVGALCSARAYPFARHWTNSRPPSLNDRLKIGGG